MNTIDIPITDGVLCFGCKKNIFAVTTPIGADYISCPICGTMIENGGDDMVELNEDTSICYCTSCKIVFDTGCTHAVNGCTDDIYYAIFLCKIKNNGTIIEMPMFDYNNQKEIVLTLEKKEYKWICMCKGKCDTIKCPKACYPNYPDMECCCNLNLSNCC